MFFFLKENLPERLQDATGHVVEWDHTANKKKKKKSFMSRKIYFHVGACELLDLNLK